MLYLVIIMVLVLLLQVGMFIYIRSVKHSPGNNVLGKYEIRTAKDAWNLINDPSIPDTDKEQIEVFYRGMLNQ